MSIYEGYRMPQPEALLLAPVWARHDTQCPNTCNTADNAFARSTRSLHAIKNTPSRSSRSESREHRRGSKAMGDDKVRQPSTRKPFPPRSQETQQRRQIMVTCTNTKRTEQHDQSLLLLVVNAISSDMGWTPATTSLHLESLSPPPVPYHDNASPPGQGYDYVKA